MPANDDPDRLPWYHRPVWVLVLLFVVLGPLGLPTLWRSPAFSRGAKIALTIVMVVYTVALIDQLVRTMRFLTEDADLLGLT